MQPPPIGNRLFNKATKKLGQMNTRVSLFLFCMQMLTVSGFSMGKTVVGNGKLLIKDIKISDYDEIIIAGSMDFEYEQSNASPYLQITIDENLFSLLTVEVKGKTLEIYPKSEDGSKRKNSPSYNLQPTKFHIKSNSKQLHKLNAAISGDFTVNSPIQSTNLEVNMAGSGAVKFNKGVAVSNIEYNMAGSGNIMAKKINATKVYCNLASSGSIYVGGTADNADYNVAGSGSINSFDCQVKHADCNIAASGKIETKVSTILDANIIGSGEIVYKGDPRINQSVMGSGSVKKRN